jgi:hypothetical protein
MGLGLVFINFWGFSRDARHFMQNWNYFTKTAVEVVSGSPSSDLQDFESKTPKNFFSEMRR